MTKTSFDLLAASPKISVVWSERRFSSVVEQLIRNERVNGSNPLSGSPLFQEDYLLKPKDFGGFSARSVGARRSCKRRLKAEAVGAAVAK
jgi:hypothetical protein